MEQKKQDNEMRIVYECKDYVIKAEEPIPPEKVTEVVREINQARSGETFGELMSLLVSMVVVLMLLWCGSLMAKDMRLWDSIFEWIKI